ncbi:MAG: STAS domain-containing protein [Bacteroidia bacterium]
MTFEYISNKINNINVFALKGELIDRLQGEMLLKEVDEAIKLNENKILLDLSELKYINSSGLSIFLNILTRSRKAGGDVAICSVNKKITELMVITKLNSVFNVRENINEAIKLLTANCE